jgi:type I restriction enzyme S subunit
MSEVPEGWNPTRLGDLGRYVNGRAFKPTEWGSEGLPIIRIQNLTSSQAAFNYFEGTYNDRHFINDGDLLVSWSATLGAFIWDRGPALLNQHIFKVYPTPKVEKRFLFYLINHILHELEDQTHGSTMKHITKGKFDGSECAIPDILTQKALIARIDECFSRVSEMEALHKELESDLSIITDASVRQLTNELRHEHPCLTIREIVAHDSTAMRSGPFGSAMKHDEFVPDGHLVIGIANVQENRFEPVRKWMIDDAKFEVMKRYSVEPGDVLITIMGTIGRTCVVPEDIGSAITSKHVYRIRFPKKRVNPHYISYLINFDSKTREQLFGTAAGGVMPGLNATKLRDLSIPLPPLKIQDRVVEQLDRTHAALQEMRALHSAPDLTHLRTAILREAFAGRL